MSHEVNAAAANNAQHSHLKGFFTEYFIPLCVFIVFGCCFRLLLGSVGRALVGADRPNEPDEPNEPDRADA